MIGQEWKYKGKNFSDLLGKLNELILVSSDRNLALKTTIRDKANNHGTYSSNTLAGGRIFNFAGVIFNNEKHGRHHPRDELASLICPEPNPVNNAFYDLKWKTDAGHDRWVKAKVYQVPFPKNGQCDPYIEFDFKLYSEGPEVYGGEPGVTKKICGSVGHYGGNNLRNLLPNNLNQVSGALEIYNAGNRNAPCTITVKGECLDCHIINVTTGHHLQVSGTTYDLKTSTINLGNSIQGGFTMTDGLASIRDRREHGVPLYLAPGNNKIVIIDQLYRRQSIETCVERYDTFIY